MNAAVSGFSQQALDGLFARVLAAARVLDPEFPDLGTYVEVGLTECGPGEQSRSYQASIGSCAISMWVDEEVQDGIGGPIAMPRSAGFSVSGLAAGAELRGRWTGTTHSDVVILGEPERVIVARTLLPA